MLAMALVALCGPAAPGQPADELFPGRWVPVQIGIVRYAERPEGEWAKPELEITLEWQPEEPDRLRWLSVEACREASERAARDCGPTMDTFILAGDRIYHPRSQATSFRYGGPAEVRMLFDLPEGLPDTLDLFVRQSAAGEGAGRQPFSASTVLAEEGSEWRTGPIAWTLDRVDPGVELPDPREPGAAELSREYALRTTWLPVLGQPAECTRVTLIGTMGPGAPVSDLGLRSAVLTAEGEEWPALRVTWARKQYTLVPGADGRLIPQRVDALDASTYLMLWFPVPSLPNECELTLEGGVVPDPVDASLEHVFSDLPILSVP